ncbi:hypothetical protein [Burkholderia pseudomultivorans]|nr:hypothetical protein [Burkholderia pseudomultivorans]
MKRYPSIAYTLLAALACTGAHAQNLADDTPVRAPAISAAPIVPAVPPPQRSAQPPVPGIPGVASAASSADAALDAATDTRVVPDPDLRARQKLRRPLSLIRPQRIDDLARTRQNATGNVWRSDALYASPYATSSDPRSPDAAR